MVAEAAGLGAAIDYLSNIGMNEIRNHEIELTDYALGKTYFGIWRNDINFWAQRRNRAWGRDFLYF